MEKTFHYKHATQYVSFLAPIVLMIGIFVWGIYGLVTEGPLTQYKLACIVMPILILSAVIGLNNPTRVRYSDDSIVFQAFGLRHVYVWNEVDHFKIKKYPMGNTLISIGRPQIFGGRYWLRGHLEGYEELLHLLSEKEAMLAESGTLATNGGHRG